MGLGAALGLGGPVACSCSERTTTTDTQPDPQEKDRLCTALCERRDRCAKEHGTYDDTFDSPAECVDNCLDFWFHEDRAACYDAAVMALECESQAICSQEDETTPTGALLHCKREKYPFSACVPNPSYWTMMDCTPDRCLAGECCTDPPPP